MSESRPGWYPDPSGDSSKLRFWDGEGWTDSYTASPIHPQGTAQGITAPTPPVRTSPAAPSSQDATLRLIAFIFCLVSTITSGWLLLPLAWMVPMTVRSWGIYKNSKPNTVAFGVCTLIFVSLVGGILLLVSSKDE